MFRVPSQCLVLVLALGSMAIACDEVSKVLPGAGSTASAPGASAASKPRTYSYAAPPTSWSAGQTVQVRFHLNASDREGMACASPTTFGALRCGRPSITEAWPDGGGGPLQPFTTLHSRGDGSVLFLASGVWEIDAVVAATRKGRAMVTCQLALRGVATSTRVRWAKGSPWAAPITGRKPTEVWAGTVTGCRAKSL